jgi:uncharacterized membrane protein
MLTLVAGTAVVLALTLVVGLVAVLVFLTEIQSFMSQTAATLETVDERAARLAARFQRIQEATAAAASELPASWT